eukprot:10454867-Alexandrium_andersonii.AAC.1
MHKAVVGGIRPFSELLGGFRRFRPLAESAGSRLKAFETAKHRRQPHYAAFSSLGQAHTFLKSAQ